MSWHMPVHEHSSPVMDLSLPAIIYCMTLAAVMAVLSHHLLWGYNCALSKLFLAVVLSFP